MPFKSEKQRKWMNATEPKMAKKWEKKEKMKKETKVKSLIKKMVREILDEDKNPCWKGYKMVGMKDKGGRQVPNCVPIDEGKLAEGKMTIQLQIPSADKKITLSILKKMRLKPGRDYDLGAGKGATFILDLNKKYENKILEPLMKNRVRVKGL